MRVTRKMMNDNSVYNINANKEYMDKVNTQMATQKKFVDPSDDPITAVRALRFRSNLSEVTQYLGRNVSDAVSWTESTQTSIDSAKEIMRSLKAEYTSAANGTNESKDQRIYYENMKNLVDEYFSLGNASSEDRHLFTGYRTQDSLTFTAADFEARQTEVKDGKFSYVNITETMSKDDIESHTFTSRTGSGAYGSIGVTDAEIASPDTSDVNETQIQNVQVYRIRLSYKELDAGISHSLQGIDFVPVDQDYQIPLHTDSNGNLVPEAGKIYYNKNDGSLIFGEQTRDQLLSLMKANNGTVEFGYNKSTWHVGDVKPEYYFDCVDIGLNTSTPPDTSKYITYNDHQQAMNYHMGDSQDIKVNANACDVFTLDARRDLDEIYDLLNRLDSAQSKVDRLKNMQDSGTGDPQKVSDLLAAATKELEYAQKRVNEAFSRGMTRAEAYFDFVNLAGTTMGTTVKRLELIKTRLTEDKTTVQTQTSNNENIDLSVLTVDLSEATLSYSAALQVTGKISQQTLVNYI